MPVTVSWIFCHSQAISHSIWCKVLRYQQKLRTCMHKILFSYFLLMALGTVSLKSWFVFVPALLLSSAQAFTECILYAPSYFWCYVNMSDSWMGKKASWRRQCLNLKVEWEVPPALQGEGPRGKRPWGCRRQQRVFRATEPSVAETWGQARGAAGKAEKWTHKMLKVFSYYFPPEWWPEAT